MTADYSGDNIVDPRAERDPDRLLAESAGLREQVDRERRRADKLDSTLAEKQRLIEAARQLDFRPLTTE
jgi:hypothetical protein